MNRDYKATQVDDAGQADLRQNLTHGKAHWLGLVASMAILSSIFFLGTDNAKATRTEALALGATPTAIAPKVSTHNASTRINLPLAIPGSKAMTSSPLVDLTDDTDANNNWRHATVKSGDSLALIFARQGLSSQQIGRAHV